MNFEETPEQANLRAELRKYFAMLLTPEVAESLHGAHSTAAARRSLWRQLGTDGLLGLGWPEDLGGWDRPAADQFIFFDEAVRAGAPLPTAGLTTVASALLQHGTPELQSELLPRLAAGEAIFAIGYREEHAGSDLSNLATTAVKDGDHWIISGHKVWTTGAHEADYVLLACTTDPDADHFRGVSIIIVPTNAEGFSWSPILTIDDGHSTHTRYENVRVPLGNLVGPLHGGWDVMTGQAAAETLSTLALDATTFRLFDETVAWAVENRSIDEPWVQLELGHCCAQLDALHLLRWKVVHHIESGHFSSSAASVAKVLGAETATDVHERLLGIVGPVGRFRSGSAASGVEAGLTGDLEHAGRGGHLRSIRDGVNEAHRDVIAWHALGMNRRTELRDDA